MARTDAPHSATAQFFINLDDNDFLDPCDQQHGTGYAVFGKVSAGTGRGQQDCCRSTTTRWRTRRNVPCEISWSRSHLLTTKYNRAPKPYKNGENPSHHFLISMLSIALIFVRYISMPTFPLLLISIRDVCCMRSPTMKVECDSLYIGRNTLHDFQHSFWQQPLLFIWF